jgi:hypothetical protein
MGNNDPLITKMPTVPEPTKQVLEQVQRLKNRVELCECLLGLPLILWYDARSKAFYCNCHMTGRTLASLADLEAVLDPEESEDYKLNRELYLDNYAYRVMEADAKRGRSFEDIVTEFDESYRNKTPLKVFGGQHRVQAIREAAKDQGDRTHGVRVYFSLDIEQKVDIATVSNTSIAISNDLLDRMREELLGTELRDWAQAVGLLQPDQGFADRRDSAGRPTVRIARTFVVNFHEGHHFVTGTMPEPHVCKSGASNDEQYEALRPRVSWTEPCFLEAGMEFTRLHQAQRTAVLGRDKDSHLEYANKCMHPSVAAAWAYVAGMLQSNPTFLANHYALGSIVRNDPLNAGALSKARLKGLDPDTYRGLGARISSGEVGRMVQLFSLQATVAAKRGITLAIANAAIKSFEALKAVRAADEAKKGI